MRAKQYSSKVKCYDCQKSVFDLKNHRAECPNSRKNKSSLGVSSVKQKKARIIGGTTDIYFLLDVSGSMTGIRLESAKNTLRTIEQDMSGKDRIAVVTFDSEAFFKLKPRPVEQIRRQQELQPLLDRIFARGSTAIWDAIYLAISQLKDKSRKTVMIVLTDGDDNTSKHTYQECLELLDEYTNVSLSIIHVDNHVNNQYEAMVQRGRGDYILIKETTIETTIITTFKKYYQ